MPRSGDIQTRINRLQFKIDFLCQQSYTSEPTEQLVNRIIKLLTRKAYLYKQLEVQQRYEAALPIEERLIYQGYTPKEIAQLTGLSVRTIYRRQRRDKYGK